MTVRVVRDEIEREGRLRLVAPVEEPAREAQPPDGGQQLSPVRADAVRIQAIGVLTALAAATAARFVLMVAVVSGALIFGYAAWTHSLPAVAAASLYAALVIIPLILLAWRKD